MKLEAFIFPPSPYSQALLFFLEDAEIEYVRKIVNLRLGENKTAKFKLINPTMKIPALRLGSFSFGETTTILRYLAIKYLHMHLTPLK